MGTTKYNSKNGMITIEVDGLDGIDWGLSHLPIELRSKALDKAMKDACRVVVKRAKELVPAPGYPGDKPEFKALRDTIGYVVRKYESCFVGVVGPERPAGAHGHLVELGTKAHDIYASGVASRVPVRRGKARERALARYANMTRKKVLANAATGTIFGSHVKHPGSKANPFMATSATETRRQQQQAITDAIAEAITRVMVKHAA